VAASLGGILFSALAANAQDATWLAAPGTGDFNTAANWTPATVPTGTASFGASNTTNLTISAATTIGGWTFNAGASNYTFTNNGSLLTFTGAGIVINGGSANITSSFMDFQNSSTAGSATITTSQVLEFDNSSTAGSATITNTGNVGFDNSSTAGNATITNNSYLVFQGTSTAGNATITNNDALVFFDSGTAGSATITNNGDLGFNDTSTAGNARLINGATGVIDLSGLTSGGMTAGSIEGGGNYYLGGNALTVGGNNLSTTVSGVISDCGAGGTACANFGVGPTTGGSLIKVGTGTLTLLGANTYTGATTVNGGTLEVDGSIANTSSVTVNSGGTLSGIGTVDPVTTTTMSGGTLAPGNPSNPAGTLTIAGNLVFQSAASYMTTINAARASNTSVSGGSATLGGASVTIAGGSAIVGGDKYTILAATGGVTGTFNPTVTYLGDPGTLSYDGNDVYLTFAHSVGIDLPSQLPPGAPANVVAVANAIDNFLNGGGGTLPANVLNLFNLSPTQLQAALSQLDGEASTDAEKGAFELMNQFMGLMLDPFVAGRGGSLNGNGLGFAPEQQASFPPEIAEAYASVFKAAPASLPSQQWTTWGSGFGASSTTNGNAAVGSNNVTASDYGFAGGMDYHVTPSTLFGFALAGAGTNWNLAQGLGGGRSDAFQAGVYTKSYYGPAYVAGALAFANNWFTTDRTALGDQLQASFNGQSYGGRFETGYRFGLPATGGVIGATPYAAIQTQWFHTPTYSETDLSGGGLGLTYNSMTANDTRSELGARFDDLTALNGMPLILRTRLAWAHDWVSNPALDAMFQSLPGASFIVNGAKPPADSALVSAGAELHMNANWSLAAKFDGEFASGSETCGGSGTLRYTW
jgi:autotransporter-associated beta strand protein